MPAVMTAVGRLQQHVDLLPEQFSPAELWPAFFVRSDGITTGRLERTHLVS